MSDHFPISNHSLAEFLKGDSSTEFSVIPKPIGPADELPKDRPTGILVTSVYAITCYAMVHCIKAIDPAETVLFDITQLSSANNSASANENANAAREFGRMIGDLWEIAQTGRRLYCRWGTDFARARRCVPFEFENRCWESAHQAAIGTAAVIAMEAWQVVHPDLSFGPDGSPSVPVDRDAIAANARTILEHFRRHVALRDVSALRVGVHAEHKLLWAEITKPGWDNQPTGALAATPKQPAGDDVAEQYVTLDQMAALVNRNKRTLARKANATNSDMPAPDVEGGGGIPHEWKWATIRPWLEKEFKRQLPERFPR